MTDEKREDPVKDAEAPKAPVVPEVAAVPPAAAQADAPVKEEAPAAKREKPANCAGCKKSIKNKRWYYRNGKYYCTKRCWSTTNKTPQKTEEAPK